MQRGRRVLAAIFELRRAIEPSTAAGRRTALGEATAGDAQALVDIYRPPAVAAWMSVRELRGCCSRPSGNCFSAAGRTMRAGARNGDGDECCAEARPDAGRAGAAGAPGGRSIAERSRCEARGARGGVAPGMELTRRSGARQRRPAQRAVRSTSRLCRESDNTR